MFPSMGHVHGCFPSLVFTFSLLIILLLIGGYSEASVYHVKGMCSYKDKYYKPGESFRRGCDKCFCHDFGAYCFPPMKPTSWPRKCRQIQAECGYTVVFKEDPLKKCQAYSWIG